MRGVMPVVVKIIFWHDLGSGGQMRFLWWRYRSLRVGSEMGFVLWVLFCLKWRSDGDVWVLFCSSLVFE